MKYHLTIWALLLITINVSIQHIAKIQEKKHGACAFATDWKSIRDLPSLLKLETYSAIIEGFSFKKYMRLSVSQQVVTDGHLRALPPARIRILTRLDLYVSGFSASSTSGHGPWLSFPFLLFVPLPRASLVARFFYPRLASLGACHTVFFPSRPALQRLDNTSSTAPLFFVLGFVTRFFSISPSLGVTNCFVGPSPFPSLCTHPLFRGGWARNFL